MKKECPSCKKLLDETADQKWLPFCSERCKLIDFGAWMNGGYTIPGEEVIIIADDDEIMPH